MTEVIKKGTAFGTAEAEFFEGDLPVHVRHAEEVGQWYWVNKDDSVKWLGCVTHIGSNFIELTSVNGGTARIHIDEFDQLCEFEPEAEKHIADKIDSHQQNVKQLMAEVKRITASLSVPVHGALPAPEETNAIVVRGNANIDDYKKALVKAKTDQLPKLFKAIEEENKKSALWMKANLIPLLAQAEGLQPVIKAIENRIFNVELYAGLTEQVKKIQDGVPALPNEKIVLFQRRAYMDEECLADYETGGMDFEKVSEFERWLLKPNNLTRLLPFPRCILAFRVRREGKEYEGWTFRDFIDIQFKNEQNMKTYLYMRNGEQVYRLRTGIEFGEQLFPDIENLDTTKKLYVSVYNGNVKHIIDEHQYEVRMSEYEEHERTKSKEYEYGEPVDCLCKKGEGRRRSCVYRHMGSFGEGITNYKIYDDTNVYYDDITEHLQEEMAKHNRLVLVLQGLLDRSPIFHPHLNWSLQTQEGFNSGIRLVYDDTRALTPGDMPDFEEYREQMNEGLKTGSITIGQEGVWIARETEKENERRRNDRGYGQGYYEVSRWAPSNDPGPGQVARVAKYSPKSGKCKFNWTRGAKRGRYGSNGKWQYASDIHIPASIDVPTNQLFCIDSYRAGDYHKFFDDPRTRATYMQWAPYLLAAEEYLAGNLKAEDDVPDKMGNCTFTSHSWSSNSPTRKGHKGDFENGDPCDCGKKKYKKIDFDNFYHKKKDDDEDDD
jgi:hypothetical protein